MLFFHNSSRHWFLWPAWWMLCTSTCLCFYIFIVQMTKWMTSLNKVISEKEEEWHFESHHGSEMSETKDYFFNPAAQGHFPVEDVTTTILSRADLRKFLFPKPHTPQFAMKHCAIWHAWSVCCFWLGTISKVFWPDHHVVCCGCHLTIGRSTCLSVTLLPTFHPLVVHCLCWNQQKLSCHRH